MTRSPNNPRPEAAGRCTPTLPRAEGPCDALDGGFFTEVLRQMAAEEQAAMTNKINFELEGE